MAVSIRVQWEQSARALHQRRGGGPEYLTAQLMATDGILAALTRLWRRRSGAQAPCEREAL
jgi:hypothetical protein